MQTRVSELRSARHSGPDLGQEGGALVVQHVKQRHLPGPAWHPRAMSASCWRMSACRVSIHAGAGRAEHHLKQAQLAEHIAQHLLLDVYNVCMYT